jgi:hypothetical protein
MCVCYVKTQGLMMRGGGVSAGVAHQFAPRFPRQPRDRAEDDYYPQPAAGAGAHCLTVPNDKKTVYFFIVTSRGNSCPRLL